MKLIQSVVKLRFWR